MSDKTFTGVGQLAVDGRIIENPSTFEVTVEYEEIVLKNTGSLDRGNYKSKKSISAINWSATVHDFSAAMLSRLLSGSYAEVAAAPVVDEQIIALEGLLAPTADVIDIGQTVSITDNAGTHATSTAFAVDDYIKDGTHLYRATTAGTTDVSAPTFPTDGGTVVDGGVTWQDEGVFAAVKDTDFVAYYSGIKAVAGAGIPDKCPINVSYTKHLADKVQVGGSVLADAEINFDGINDDDNTPMVARFFKNAIASDGGVPLITDGEYGGVTISGSVTLDTSKPSGVSKFGTLVVGKTAVV